LFKHTHTTKEVIEADNNEKNPKNQNPKNPPKIEIEMECEIREREC